MEWRREEQAIRDVWTMLPLLSLSTQLAVLTALSLVSDPPVESGTLITEVAQATPSLSCWRSDSDSLAALFTMVEASHTSTRVLHGRWAQWILVDPESLRGYFSVVFPCPSVLRELRCVLVERMGRTVQ